MNTNFQIDGTMILIGLAAGAAAYVAYKKKEIIEAVNPADDNNIINRQVSEVVQKISNGESENLGEAIYKTRDYNPVAWLFEGIGKLTGDLP